MDTDVQAPRRSISGGAGQPISLILSKTLHLCHEENQPPILIQPDPESQGCHQAACAARHKHALFDPSSASSSSPCPGHMPSSAPWHWVCSPRELVPASKRCAQHKTEHVVSSSRCVRTLKGTSLLELPKTTVTQTHRRVYSFPRGTSDIKHVLLAGWRQYSRSAPGETGIHRGKVTSPGFLKTTSSKAKTRRLCIPAHCGSLEWHRIFKTKAQESFKT